MIGYRDERYLYFGRAAARIDDVANYIPARLSAVCIAAASAFTTGRLRPALRTCLADARKHLSPNAGFPESAMAGALGAQSPAVATVNTTTPRRAIAEFVVNDHPRANRFVRSHRRAHGKRPVFLRR
jgi:hypothetical protein